MNATTKMSDKVVNYEELTASLREKFYPTMIENTPMISCIRKTKNGTFQVEFMERKASSTTNSISNGGMNLTFVANRGHDDRFKEFIKIERAWAIMTSRAALEDVVGKLSEEDFEALDGFEIDSMDRLRIMKAIPTIVHEGNNYQVHIAVTEAREIEIEEGSIALNNSQRQSLEHENSIKRTGGENNELIVCGRTGSAIRKITEVKVFELGASIKDIDTTVPNQVLESVFLGSKAGGKTIVTGKNIDKVTENIFGAKEE